MNNRIILAWLFLLAVPVDAKDTTVRLSLLRDEAPRAILDGLLAEAGCTKPTRRAFFRVAEIYSESPRYPCENFGVKVDGWYRFATPQDLLRKMPYPFYETPVTSDSLEQHTLACVSIAALLLRDQTAESLGPSLWPKDGPLIRGWPVNGEMVLNNENLDGRTLAAIPGVLYPLNGYKMLTGQTTRSTCEEGIVIGLVGCRGTPRFAASDTDAVRAVVDEKLADLEGKRLNIEGQLKPVIVHYLRADDRMIGLEHIGLLIEARGKCYYLEKNGASGPFVLLETVGRDAVIDYVAGHYGAVFEGGKYPETAEATMCLSIGPDVVRIRDYSEKSR